MRRRPQNGSYVRSGGGYRGPGAIAALGRMATQEDYGDETPPIFDEAGVEVISDQYPVIDRGATPAPVVVVRDTVDLIPDEILTGTPIPGQAVARNGGVTGGMPFDPVPEMTAGTPTYAQERELTDTVIHGAKPTEPLPPLKLYAPARAVIPPPDLLSPEIPDSVPWGWILGGAAVLWLMTRR